MSETRWVRAAKTGDLYAFNRLVLRYQDEVYSLASLLLSDGEQAAAVTGQVFMHAFGQVRHCKESFRLWLLARAVETLRQSMVASPSIPVTGASDLAAGLHALPREQAILLALVDIAGLSLEEASLVSGFSTRRLSQELAQARRSLQPLALRSLSADLAPTNSLLPAVNQ